MSNLEKEITALFEYGVTSGIVMFWYNGKRSFTARVGRFSASSPLASTAIKKARKKFDKSIENKIQKLLKGDK